MQQAYFHLKRLWQNCWSVLFVTTLCIEGSMVWANELSLDEVEYFERHIRPVLVENCYSCHGGEPEKIKGEFNLTFRDGIRKSGEQGHNVVPNDAGKSALLDALRYDDPDFQMPPSGKLPELVIQYFEDWISMGAPDPRDDAFKEGDAGLEEVWAQTLEHRKSWWSYQPIKPSAVPKVEGNTSTNPIDAFIHASWKEEGVGPSPKANPYTLIRRLSFVLVGLPPTQEEITAFVKAYPLNPQGTVDATVDRLLGSPQFGERWARHWMDWMRYAETHGSEGDPRIPHAWRYRDYMIRALNADVPFDDLVREQLAGDLLPEPRINESLGLNESKLGIGQYRFVLHGFAPTDALDEFVRFTENQVDTISKAFLGSTVSCARCHNHKFDPISQKDFYALFGIMASTRPATVLVDSSAQLNMHKHLLSANKQGIRAILAEQWINEVDALMDELRKPDGPWKKSVDEAKSAFNPLHAWHKLRDLEGDAFTVEWNRLNEQFQQSHEALVKRHSTVYPIQWNMGSEDAQTWTQDGNGVDGGYAKAGDFNILHEGNRIVEHIYPAGVYTHLLSKKHSGVVSSPRFDLTESNIYLRIIGNDKALNRYVIQNYPRNGTVFPIKHLSDGKWQWQRWNMDYWKGDKAYLELSTAPDQAILADDNKTRSWFGVAEALMQGKDQPAPKDEIAEYVFPLFRDEGIVSTPEDLFARYTQSLKESILAWRSGTMDNEQARYLESFLSQGLLTNTLAVNAKLDALVNEYRRLENEVPIPTRAPGIIENAPFDQALYARGDHKKPEEAVSRRFIEAIDSTPYGDDNAGRLKLAESIVDANNPLTARVISNRLWHHTFGQGIVTTPDDFGAMGQLPSHPALLDYLAQSLIDNQWSLKKFIRLLVTSETFQLSAVPTADAKVRDPNNALLSHANIRRLEGEAIRDALLYSAGRLNTQAPVGNVDGNSDRRSIYVRVIRNNLDPFLTTFDAPVPVSTKGRRDSTNVPTHSLTLMNDPFVRAQAKELAETVSNDPLLSTVESKVKGLFLRIIGRPPTGQEVKVLIEYMQQAQARPSGAEYDSSLVNDIEILTKRKRTLSKEIKSRVEEALVNNAELAKKSSNEQKKTVAGAQVKELDSINQQLDDLKPLAGPSQPWVELTQSLFSLKEFIYLH